MLDLASLEGDCHLLSFRCSFLDARRGRYTGLIDSGPHQYYFEIMVDVRYWEKIIVEKMPNEFFLINNRYRDCLEVSWAHSTKFIHPSNHYVQNAVDYLFDYFWGHISEIRELKPDFV